jgi:hypothetical protein
VLQGFRRLPAAMLQPVKRPAACTCAETESLRAASIRSGASPDPTQKFRLRRRANQWPLFARLAPTRGALRDRHECWARDAMGALASPDERHRCARRNRVVLIPRRWNQVGA